MDAAYLNRTDECVLLALEWILLFYIILVKKIFFKGQSGIFFFVCKRKMSWSICIFSY